MTSLTLTETVETPGGRVERPVRVNFPVLVSFSTDPFTIREFTLNLSEGGMFIPTERMCPKGTRGTLKFRATQYDAPLMMQAEVVRTVEPGAEDESEVCGLGLKLLDVSDENLTKLRDVIEGVHNGTVVDTIRKSLITSSRTLGQELRLRPTDQKMMLAMSANPKEIEVLVRDFTPSVLLRLLENPRTSPGHVLTMLRNPKLPTRVLSAIKTKGRFLAGAEARYLFCAHINTNLSEAMQQLSLLPPDRLRKISMMAQAKSQIRSRAQELTRKKNNPHLRHR